MRYAKVRSHWWKLAVLGGTVVALVGSGGCRRAAPPRGSTIQPPALRLDTPEHATRSLLTGLAALHQAIADDDADGVKACRKTLRSVVAREELIGLIDLHPRIKLAITDGTNADEAELVDGMVRNWASATSYYIDGVHLDRMFRAAAAGAQRAGRVAVVVPASGPKDDALIQVTCVRGRDGQWRILRVEFVAEATPMTPASQSAPASRP